MRIEAVELHQLEIPMVEPLASSYGTVEYRQTVLVQLTTDVGVGWGECVALNEPLYSGEWSNGEYALLRDVFIPHLFKCDDVTAENIVEVLKPFKQHTTAKTAIELAILDAQLRSEKKSIAEYFGATVDSVECAVVVGLLEGDALIRSVQSHLDRGYRQVKLKIAPGRDVERIDLLHSVFPDLAIRVDANGSYDWFDEGHRRLLKELNERDIKFLEQPFAPDRVRPFAELREFVSMPIAFDESVTSWNRAMNALDFPLCDVMLIKPAMLGGYALARRLQLECQERGVPTCIGGMIETAIARAANIALAATSDNVEYPAEVSPDGRWFKERINLSPVDMVDGRVPVSNEPGLGVELDYAVVERLTRRSHAARVS